MTTIDIRQTNDTDLPAIVAVQEGAFGHVEEADLTLALLQDPSAEPRLSLLALRGTEPVGHILFTKVTVAGAADVAAAILAPLAVTPAAQNDGVGGLLIRAGLERLAEDGVGLVFVLGHPGYYPRFGFAPAGAQGLTAPYPIPPEHADAWMVQDLKGGLLGRVTGPISCADALDKPELWRE